MNLQQQREEARRRRLINRSVVQHRQRYFDEVRRGIVVQAATPGRELTGPLAISPQFIAGPALPDNPAVTRFLKAGIVATMLGLVVQFRSPLLDAVLSAIPGVAG